MSKFNDDNSRTSYSNYGDDRPSNVIRYNGGRGEKATKDLVRRSTSSTEQKDKVHVVKAQQRKQQRERRMATLLVCCMIFGGVAVGAANEVVEDFQDYMTVYEERSQFKKDVIYPNTHRTDDLQGYFYDYDDIADAIMAEGKDFSTELYKAYCALGEFQTNRVLKHTDYDSLEEYVSANGFKDIDAWCNVEKEKIILQAEIAEKTSELAEMHRELNDSHEQDVVDESYVGGYYG